MRLKMPKKMQSTTALPKKMQLAVFFSDPCFSLLIGCSSFLQVIVPAASTSISSISSILALHSLALFSSGLISGLPCCSFLQLLGVCMDLFIFLPDLLALFECLVIL